MGEVLPMRYPKRLATPVAFVVLALTGAASAQTKDTGYIYDFPEDDLVGQTLTTTPPLIKIRRPSPRIMLLRPRANFVAELLKSVEVL